MTHEPSFSKRARCVVSVFGCVMLVAPTSVCSQAVRGQVTDSLSRLPVVGVVVTLERATGSPSSTPTPVATTLSRRQGLYGLHARGPGRYRVTAKRIGSRPASSVFFELSDGETRRVDLAINLTMRTLAEVIVGGATTCDRRSRVAARIGALWSDARAALTAVRVSQRDSLVPSRLVRFARMLDVGTRAVQWETHESIDAPVWSDAATFRSLSGDSLHALGYWRHLGNSTLEFHAPDAAALLSPAFVEDHCFSITMNAGARSGLLGLAFQPVVERRLPDIRGTVWMDSTTSELRYVEFVWTQLPGDVYGRGVGGEVYFSRLDDGPWTVRRWSIRMPDYVVAQHRSGTTSSSSPVLASISEEGGMVLAAGLRHDEQVGTIVGTVRDDNGAAIEGARVRVEGSRFAARSAGDGSYRIDGIPPGPYVLAVEHPSDSGYGARTGVRDVVLDEGATRRVDFQPVERTRTRESEPPVCATAPPDRFEASLRIRLVDDRDGHVLSGQAVRLQWSAIERTEHGGVTVGTLHVERGDVNTGPDGTATFCELPASHLLEFGVPIDSTRMRVLQRFTLLPRQAVVQIVRMRPPVP